MIKTLKYIDGYLSYCSFKCGFGNHRDKYIILLHQQIYNVRIFEI